MIPACESFGVGLLPWSPLGGGLLAGTSQDTDQRASPAMRARIDAIRATEVELAPDTLADLDDIFPGPGPAPEAYER